MRETLPIKGRAIKTPTEGIWFEVNPTAINQKLFEDERKNIVHERVRKFILEAFSEVENNPAKYAGVFETLEPEKVLEEEEKSIGELKELATILGDHNADWVELALEIAQRVDNGEPWEKLCDEEDTAKWYRVVIWKNGYARLVGGSTEYGGPILAPTHVSGGNYREFDKSKYAIPKVVRYKSTVR